MLMIYVSLIYYHISSIQYYYSGLIRIQFSQNIAVTVGTVVSYKINNDVWKVIPKNSLREQMPFQLSFNEDLAYYRV